MTHCGNDEMIFDVSIFPKDATTPTSKSGWLFSNRWGGHLWCWRPLISQKSLTGFVKLVTTPSGLVVVIRSELVQTSSLETTRFWSLKWRCVQTALSQAFFTDYNTYLRSFKSNRISKTKVWAIYPWDCISYLAFRCRVFIDLIRVWTGGQRVQWETRPLNVQGHPLHLRKFPLHFLFCFFCEYFGLKNVWKQNYWRGLKTYF